MKNKWLLSFLLVLCLGIAAYAGIQVYKIYHGYHESSAVYQALAQYVAMPEVTTAPPYTPVPTTSGQPPAAPERDWPTVDFTSLQKINPDIVGWIFCEGTAINYPVVRGQDNSYYLTHLFDETYNSSGCIFLDYRCASDFSDTCSTIYGHHMKDGSMFSGITEYQTQAYYDAHPEFLLLTPAANYVLEIFSGYITTINSDAWITSFEKEESYAQWLSDTAASSSFQSRVTPTTQDHVVTLSTCTYEFQNARFVLVCVLRTERQN